MVIPRTRLSAAHGAMTSKLNMTWTVVMPRLVQRSWRTSVPHSSSVWMFGAWALPPLHKMHEKKKRKHDEDDIRRACPEHRHGGAIRNVRIVPLLQPVRCQSRRDEC